MILKKIKEKEYENFVKNSDLSSFYQSIEWYHLKQKEGKKCELLGLFDNDKLIGVSLVVYVKILKKYYYAYASRGFIYDYQNILEFTKALKDYFKNKAVFVKIDPPIILAKYDKNKDKESFLESKQLIESLKYYGFKHYGYNLALETEQFRFVHRIKLEKRFDKQLELMSKSTRKNMDIAKLKGVNIKTVNDLDLVYSFFEKSSERKQFQNLSKKFIAVYVFEYDNNIEKFANKIAAENDLEIVIMNRGESIEDWLYYIKNAELVITDSYHGTCFSIIFEKQVLPLTNTHGNSRFYSLLSIIGLENRIIENKKDFNKISNLINENINYEKINKILEKEIGKSSKWLKSATNADKNKFRESVESRLLEVLLENKKIPQGTPYIKRACKKAIKIIKWILRQIKRQLFLLTNNVNFLRF